MSLILIVMQLLFTYFPPMQRLFQTVALDAVSWIAILALGVGKFLAVEAEKAVRRRLQAMGM